MPREDLGVGPDQGQRRLQLVGGISDKCPLPDERFLDRMHRAPRHEKPAGRRQYQRSKAREDQDEDQPFHRFRHRLTRLGSLYHRDHVSELSVLLRECSSPFGATWPGDGLSYRLPLLPGSLGHVRGGEAERKDVSSRSPYDEPSAEVRSRPVVISGRLHDTVFVFAAQHAVGLVFRLLKEQVILLFA